MDLVPVGVERAGDGVLKIGSLLPQTGDLGLPRTTRVRRLSSWPSPTSTRPVACSVQPIEYSAGDSGDDKTDTANQTVDRLLSENVDAIIGAAASASP